MTRLSLLLVLALACTPKTAPPEVAATQQPERDPNGVIKPNVDNRDYRAFTLDNGMKVLVVSDPSIDLAAASLDVHVGQFSDPADREGLAHFLEHMLFMGTDRYPDVDDYRRYIQDHGGGSNAGTGQEHTSYYFSVAQDHLEPALDRFSRFFVAPRLDPDFVQRERQAANSEYSLKVKDDARRIREVKRQTSNPAHPFAKFSVGNLDTLADRDDGPVYDDLKAFYAAEYTASRMTLAVIGTESVDELEAMVRARFEEVPTNGKAPPKAEIPLFTPDQLGARVNITPLSERREIELQFPVPPDLPVYELHPISYLTRMLGQEGEGSLYIHLRDQGWAESLSAGTAGTEDTTLITVSVRLTEAGYDHIDDVIEAVFAYLRLMRSEPLPAWYHDEARTIAAQSFAWADTPTPVSVVRRAVRTLHDYRPEHVLNFWSRYEDFDETVVRKWLDRLVPENLHLIVVGPDLKTDQTEERYDAPYSLQPIAPKLLARWADAELNPALTLPSANPFVASALALKAAPEGADRPVRVGDDARLELWHHHDDSFGVPKARIDVTLFSPLASSDPKHRVMNRLLSTLVDDSLNTIRDPARQAGLSMDVATQSLGLRLTATGYDPKLPDLVEIMAKKLANFKVFKDRFEVLRARMVRGLDNVATDRPIRQAGRAVSDIFNPNATPAVEQARLARSLTAAELQDYADHVLDGVRGTILAHGNLTKAEAEAVRATLRPLLIRGDVGESGTVGGRTIPPGVELAHDMSIDHNDSVLMVQYRGGEPSIEESARFRLLAGVLKTPFFTEIRTKQQLGYTTYAYYAANDLVPGIGFGIQSSTAGPTTLLQRVDAFLADQRKVLAEMPESEIGTIRDGLITKLLQKDTRLTQRSGRYRSDLWLGYAQFDRRESVAAALGKLDKAALLQTYDRVLLSEDAGRVIVRSAGHSHSDERIAKPDCTDAACVIAKMTGVVSRRP